METIPQLIGDSHPCSTTTGVGVPSGMRNDEQGLSVVQVQGSFDASTRHAGVQAPAHGQLFLVMYTELPNTLNPRGELARS